MSELLLLDYWSFWHALAGLTLGVARTRFAPAIAAALTWEISEPYIGFGDPSFANSLGDVGVLAGAWLAGLSTRPREA